MFVPEDWDTADAVGACPVLSWEGYVWRAHSQKYFATDPGGSLRSSGRYHRGRDQFPEDQIFSALYLSLGRDICLGEIFRHVEPSSLRYLNNYRVSKLELRVGSILDCRDPALLGIGYNKLVHDTDYSITQKIGAAAFAKGVEGILVVSATLMGDNLILFPTNLSTDSQITIICSVAPSLYVERWRC